MAAVVNVEQRPGRPRVAFVIQRYGAEAICGSEALCRMIAEQMVRRAAVTVFTTCAIDPVSWVNALPAGTSTLNGVRVVRYPTVVPRFCVGMSVTIPLRDAPLVGPI